MVIRHTREEGRYHIEVIDDLGNETGEFIQCEGHCVLHCEREPADDPNTGSSGECANCGMWD